MSMYLRTFRWSAWGMLALVVLLWCAALYAAYRLSDMKNDLLLLRADAAQALEKSAAAARVSALVSQTAAERQELSARTQLDLLHVVDMIEAAGKDAGVSLNIGNASPLSGSRDALPGTLTPVAFVVQADGAFSNLVRAVALLETLPLPVALGDVEWERESSASGRRTWHLTAHLTVFTSTETPL